MKNTIALLLSIILHIVSLYTQDPQIFQHIMRQSNSMFGLYARVFNSSVVNLDDEVICL